jgi:ketosteroid isomerase-like protein
VTPTVPRDADDDGRAIRELLLRYAHGIDARDLAAVASCFAPDAAYHGALAVGTFADALAALPAAMARYAATRHTITLHDAQVTGDTARSTAECTARHWMPTGGCRVVAVRYRDQLARAPEGWRITRRDVDTLWSRDEESEADHE